MHPATVFGIILIGAGAIVMPPLVVVGLVLTAVGVFAPTRANRMAEVKNRVRDSSV